MEAEVELARARASLESSKIQLLRGQYYQSMDEQTIKSKINDHKVQIAKEKQVLRRQMDQSIPELILQVSQLQSAPILWGDYNLKIARQRYKQHKIEKAISTLLSQQARLSLLSFAYNSEATEFQTEVAAIMTSCASELTPWHANSKARRKRMEEQSQSSKNRSTLFRGTADKKVVDMTDKSTLAFIQLLRLALPGAASDGADPIELASRLGEKLKTLKQRDALETAAADEQLARSRDAASKIQEKLFSSSTTASVVTLSPPEVLESQRKLESAIQELSAAMESILREHQQKQHDISSLSKEKVVERQLWTAFFASPASLQRLFREMKGK